MSRKDILWLMLVVALAMALARCSGTGVSPSEVINDSRVVLSNTLDSGEREPSSGIVSEPTACETIGITSRRVLSVSPGEVTLQVTADFTPQSSVRVRIIANNGRSLGDYPLGVITLRLSPGDYILRVFVEVPGYLGGLIQCDGSLSFTIPPVVPPTCQELGTCPPPECDPETEECEPKCDEGQTFNGDDCEPPPPPSVCEQRDAGPYPKQGNPRAECAFFDTTPGPAGIYICKAGQEIFISSSPFTGPTCPNGKDLSHVTTCVCPEGE